MFEPELIEYVPRRRKSGMAGRFAKAMFYLGLPFALFAVYRGFHLATKEDMIIVILTAALAIFFWGLGLIGSLVSYATTGRAW